MSANDHQVIEAIDNAKANVGHFVEILGEGRRLFPEAADEDLMISTLALSMMENETSIDAVCLMLAVAVYRIEALERAAANAS